MVHKKNQECTKVVYYRDMTKPLHLVLDRSAKTSLAEQIHRGIRAAIESGVLAPGARLPSWQDLAAQLGVARGTVRIAYEKLSSAQLIVASRATGTHVADRPSFPVRQEQGPGSRLLHGDVPRRLTAGPAIFQMGVPAQETFPGNACSRVCARRPFAPKRPRLRFTPTRAASWNCGAKSRLTSRWRAGSNAPPSQIVITAGFSGGLGLALRVLGLERRRRPGWKIRAFPSPGTVSQLARLSIVPIPVDADGIDIDHGLKHAPDAALVVVTPGQQAPLGSDPVAGTALAPA